MNAHQWINGERDKCAACVHSFREDDPKQDKPGTIVRCGLLMGGKRHQFAIYAREESFCGIEARHFEAKK